MRAEKREGAAEQRDDAAGPREGTWEKREGAAEQRGGAAAQSEGASEQHELAAPLLCELDKLRLDRGHVVSVLALAVINAYIAMWRQWLRLPPIDYGEQPAVVVLLHPSSDIAAIRQTWPTRRGLPVAPCRWD